MSDPVTAVKAAYAARAEGQASAWIAVVPEAEAVARAERLVAQGPLGRPLWGVPFAVKDNIDVAGMVTTAGCPAYAYEAERTAPAVQRLLDAGAVLVGKTNLDQFATGLVGTRSPYGTPHSALGTRLIPGGSSSGSAVAVAEGVVAFALGTDTAGSGRVPAAANGIVGLKPTRGLVSNDGVVPACASIDCVSVFATDVELADRVLAVMAGGSGPAGPPAQAGTGAVGGRDGRWRVGVPEPGLWGLGPAQATAFAQALDELRTWTDVVEVDVGPLLAAGELLYEGSFVAERLLTVGPLLAASPEVLHPVVREVVSRGLERTAAEVFADQQRLRRLAAELAPLWDDVDVLACPTVPDIPTIEAVLDDPVGANAALGRWTHGVNLLDMCALTVPAGRRPDGLPGSLSLLGPAGADARLAAVARLQLPQHAADPQQEVHLAVVGAHLEGLPLHHQLADRGARLVRACRTAPVYRLHALATDPPKPGMVRVAPGEAGTAGAAIEAEVWALDVAAFGDFVAQVPPPMTIGTVELEDGSTVKGFLCEPAALDARGTCEITATGSWRVWWEAETNRSATDGRPVLSPGTTGRRGTRPSAAPTSCPPPPAESGPGG
jgi:allophanate hydrolase